MVALFRSVLSCLLVLLCCGVAGAGSSPLPEVVARVGAIPITRFEFGREVQKIYPLQASFHGKISPEKFAEIEKTALDTLIDQAYEVQYALEKEISVPNDAVDEVFAKVRQRFKSDADFQSAMGAEGVDEFRASIYRNLLAKQAEKVAVDDRVKVDDQDVRAYYDANKEKYMRPRQYQASHILIKVDPALSEKDKEVLKAKAEDLAKRAKAGEDFYNLAYYNSDDRTKYVGGDLGMFHEGQTVPEFEAALKKMSPGDIVGPIKSIYGYHIIKLVQRNEPRQLKFDEVADKIRSQLEENQREALREAWMKDLKKQYAVENLLPK